METKREIWNSYYVKFVFDYTIMSTTVFALHEDACEALAIDLIKSDTGLPDDVFDGGYELGIELIDEDVLW